MSASAQDPVVNAPGQGAVDGGFSLHPGEGCGEGGRARPAEVGDRCPPLIREAPELVPMWMVHRVGQS